jgi:hypothetical protein
MTHRLGFLDKDRFAEIELGSYHLHLVVEQSVGVEDDGKRIASEAFSREHVEEEIVELHGTASGWAG